MPTASEARPRPRLLPQQARLLVLYAGGPLRLRSRMAGAAAPTLRAASRASVTAVLGQGEPLLRAGVAGGSPGSDAGFKVAEGLAGAASVAASRAVGGSVGVAVACGGFSANGTCPPGVLVWRGEAASPGGVGTAVPVAVRKSTVFEPGDARALLAEPRRVARLGLVVTDVTRSWPAFALSWLLLHLWGSRHQLSQRDGPLSVRRAYTLREMQALAARAALPQPRIARRSLFEGVILAPAEVFGV